MYKGITNTPKVSVVIPMYNCEDFLPELLFMFSNQSFADFEVICVIDGATDGTEESVKKYCEKDNRFSYVVRENGGAGAARNTGLELARGKYVIFSDADDEYSPDYLKKLYETAEIHDAQLVICRFVENNVLLNTYNIRGFNEKILHENVSYSHEDIDDLFLSFKPRVTHTLFNVSFLREKGPVFPDYRVAQDCYFFYAALSVADRIFVVHDTLLKYRVYLNPDSITSRRKRYQHETVYGLRLLYRWLKDHFLLKDHKETYIRRVNDVICFEGGRGASPRFITEIAHMLSHEEPWSEMSSTEMLTYLEEGLFAVRSIQKEKEIITGIDINTINKDRELSFLLRCYRSRIQTSKALKQVLSDRYGKDFVYPPPTPEISVIIPMYNCEQFVSDLLLMFRNQSFEDFELICVVDGATDGTEAEVKRLCATDNRFRFVIRENGGGGAARNTGIQEAKGKYIIFSDADDEYSKDYLLKLYEAAEKNKAEIAVCGKVTIDHIIGEKRGAIGFNKAKLSEDKVYCSKWKKGILRMIDIQICNRLFLRDFLKTNKLKFSETIMGNDLFFSLASISCSDRITVIHDDLLTVRRFINPQSISSRRSDHSHMILKEWHKLYEWLKKRDLLKYYLFDFLIMFDVSVNYEIKNGINPLYAKELARILNCDEPWKKLNGDQLSRVMPISFGSKGIEKPNDTFSNDNDNSEYVKKQKRDEIRKIRNKNRFLMQQMIKKFSKDLYKRDLDDHDSESPVFLKEKSFEESASFELNKKIIYKDSEYPAITVVIPVYNATCSVKDILSRFSKQSFTDFEVICVIDGAFDHTEAEIKKACENNKKFRYVVSKGGGFGVARNTGLEAARGRYVVFSDAGDEYSEDFLKKLYETAVIHDAQITICRFIERNTMCDTEIVQGFDEKKLRSNIPYSHFAIEDLFVTVSGSITNKLYDRKFITDFALQFSGNKNANDNTFCHASLTLADRIVALRDVLMTHKLHIYQESLINKRGVCQRRILDDLRLLYRWLKSNSFLEFHGEDYMRRVNRVLTFEGGHKFFPGFIAEEAHMLNAEEPWDKMPPGEILLYLSEVMFAFNAARCVKELSDNVSPKMIGSDKELSFQIDHYKNRIHAAELLRQVSKERYGRDFSDNESVLS